MYPSLQFSRALFPILIGRFFLDWSMRQSLMLKLDKVGYLLPSSQRSIWYVGLQIGRSLR